MLRAITRQKVHEIIEKSYFGSDNYSIQFGEINSDLAFRVFYLGDASFEFTVERGGGSSFQTTEAPGMKFLAADVLRVSDFDTCLPRLERWLERVRQEVLATNPFGREVLELRAQLDERLASLGDELAGFFTKSEADSLIARLTEFEQKLRDLAGHNEELMQAVEALSATVSDLQGATQSINRGTWFRMAGGRLLGGLKQLAKSKEAREFALEAAKKFLLEGPR